MVLDIEQETYFMKQAILACAMRLQKGEASDTIIRDYLEAWESQGYSAEDIGVILAQAISELEAELEQVC